VHALFIGLTIVHKRDFVSILHFWHAADPSSVAVSFLHDILYRIASKLPPKECARTSILSSEWRCVMRSACPRLTFDAVSLSPCADARGRISAGDSSNSSLRSTTSCKGTTAGWLKHLKSESIFPCLVPFKIFKTLQDSTSHRIFEHMHEILNVPK